MSATDSTGAPAATVTTTVTEPGETITETVKAPEPKKTEAPEPAKPSIADTIDDGTWEVGEDVQPGKYKTRVDSGANCYWKIAKDAGSDLDDILQNDNVDGGPAIVNLKKGQYFTSSDCGTWKRQ
jgi:hypothetical protein